MRIKLIACEVFTRELSIAAGCSEHIIDSVFLPFGLHSTPDELRKRLQSEIDCSESCGFDLITLGYCLCSRGTVGLIARSVPIIIPRAHDCITLFLGSRSRYNREFAAHPGTYYYSPGWIERSDGEIEQGFITEKKDRERRERFETYSQQYGEDNARFLLEQESLWLANYSRAAFVNMQIGAVDDYRRFVQRVASSHCWDYEVIEGNMSFIQRLVSGVENSDDFLMVKPGEQVIETFDENIISSMCSEQEARSCIQ